MFAENILELCSRVKGDVTFSCSEQDSSADLKPLCLAAVPWELIALFALEGTVTLNMSKCKECPRRGLHCHFEQTLSEARHFLGDDRFQAAVIRCEVWDTTIPSNDRSFSRRDAFSLFFSKSKATAASLLPEDKELSPDGMLFRRLLAHRLRHLKPYAQNLSLSTPAFLSCCTACSLCTKVCPTQALHRVKGDLQGDVQRWYMALIPWRCTGCKLCTESCLSTGLSQPEWSTRADILTPVLHPVDAVPCPRCGEPLAPGQSKGLCPRCEAESAPPIVW